MKVIENFFGSSENFVIFSLLAIAVCSMFIFATDAKEIVNTIVSGFIGYMSHTVSTTVKP